MRGDEYRPIRYRDRRIQGIRQQIVVEKILVAPKASLEVVDRSFLNLQARQVIGIAAVSEVCQREVVEQESGMVGGVHVERLLEQARAAVEIHVGRPHTTIVAEVG